MDRDPVPDQQYSTQRAAPPYAVSGQLVAVLLCAVALLMARNAGLFSTWMTPPAEPRPITPRGDLAASEKSTIEIFQSVAPSVVNITSLSLKQDMRSRNLFKVPRGSGSGFIWDDRGHIVTNYHVIQNANEARVTLADNSRWEARLVGYEASKDLAVLRIDAPADRLRPIPRIGTSDDLQVGQNVFAIGSPFGLDQSLTTGVISGLGREIESTDRFPIDGVIQTDASINPGNSGGPLLDSAGRLIGVNTAIYNPTASSFSVGIGFAVPVDTVNFYVPELIKHGRVLPVGIAVTLVDESVERQLGVESGVLLWDVQEGSQAAKAGLRGTTLDRLAGIPTLGDIIVAVDGKPVDSPVDLLRAFQQKQPGDTVELTVRRDERTLTVPVPLETIERMEH